MTVFNNSASEQFRLALVDDHQVILDGLLLILEKHQKYFICGSARNAQEAMLLLIKQNPDIFLVDLALPDRNGLDLIRDLLAYKPELKIICLSALNEMRYAKMALNAGARGYVSKRDGVKVLMQAIATVSNGGIHVSSQVNKILLQKMVGSKSSSIHNESSLEELTPREFEVLLLVSEGLSTSQIGKRLHISPNTVQRHKENIKAKWNIKSSEELVRVALEYFSEWLKA